MRFLIYTTLEDNSVFSFEIFEVTTDIQLFWTPRECKNFHSKGEVQASQKKKSGDALEKVKGSDNCQNPFFVAGEGLEPSAFGL